MNSFQLAKFYWTINLRHTQKRNKIVLYWESWPFLEMFMFSTAYDTYIINVGYGESITPMWYIIAFSAHTCFAVIIRQATVHVDGGCFSRQDTSYPRRPDPHRQIRHRFTAVVTQQRPRRCLQECNDILSWDCSSEFRKYEWHRWQN